MYDGSGTKVCPEAKAYGDFQSNNGSVSMFGGDGRALATSALSEAHMGCCTYRIPELALITTMVLPLASGRLATSIATLTAAPVWEVSVDRQRQGMGWKVDIRASRWARGGRDP